MLAQPNESRKAPRKLLALRGGRVVYWERFARGVARRMREPRRRDFTMHRRSSKGYPENLIAGWTDVRPMRCEVGSNGFSGTDDNVSNTRQSLNQSTAIHPIAWASDGKAERPLFREDEPRFRRFSLGNLSVVGSHYDRGAQCSVETVAE